MNNNIVLVGFMGVGKGRTARKLAEVSQFYTVDCDDLIESYANLKVKKIFKTFGEAHFRQLERRTALWLEKNISSTIISTGGGFVNVPNVKDIGCVVYLHSSFSAILHSIMKHPNAKKKIKKRPLLQNLQEAELLYNKRLTLYREKADLEVNVEEKSMDEIAQEILAFYQNWQER